MVEIRRRFVTFTHIIFGRIVSSTFSFFHSVAPSAVHLLFSRLQFRERGEYFSNTLLIITRSLYRSRARGDIPVQKYFHKHHFFPDIKRDFFLRVHFVSADDFSGGTRGHFLPVPPGICTE